MTEQHGFPCPGLRAGAGNPPAAQRRAIGCAEVDGFKRRAQDRRWVPLAHDLGPKRKQRRRQNTDADGRHQHTLSRDEQPCNEREESSPGVGCAAARPGAPQPADPSIQYQIDRRQQAEIAVIQYIVTAVWLIATRDPNSQLHVWDNAIPAALPRGTSPQGIAVRRELLPADRRGSPMAPP